MPDTVAITEAMALVRDLSTDDSPPFVNGVLATVARHRATDDLLADAGCMNPGYPGFMLFSAEVSLRSTGVPVTGDSDGVPGATTSLGEPTRLTPGPC